MAHVTPFGYACSPLVEDGKVILPIGDEASLAALDAESGETLWASGEMPVSYCSAVPITFRGARQVVAFLHSDLAGFDPQSGRVLWRQSCSRGYTEHAAFPLYDEPYLRTMQPFRAGSDLYMIEAAPREKDASEGPAYRVKFVRHDAQMSNDVASSVLVDGRIYGFDVRNMQTSRHRPTLGDFRCMDFKTGRILWSSDRTGQATVVAADGKLLLLNDRGEVILARASATRYEELGRSEIFPGEICWTAPCLYHERLYVRSPTRVASLYVGKPERMDPRQRQLAATSATTIKAERRDLGWLVGAEREFPFELPDRRELARWYAWSLGIMAVAGLWAVVVGGAVRLWRGASSDLAAKAAFWLGLLLLGVAATPLGNACSRQFVFTWPVVLFGVHQLVLAAVLWSRESKLKGSTWVGGVAAALLILACLEYYRLTRELSLAPAWYFLATFLVAWPLAFPAARRLLHSRRLWNDVVWLCLAFSVYFWTAGGLMIWRTAVSR